MMFFRLNIMYLPNFEIFNVFELAFFILRILISIPKNLMTII